jgi:two-component system, NarL family, invasion response regulator UvrY
MTDSNTKTVKLAFVDDHNLFRKGLIKLIHMGDSGNEYQILFEAASGEDMKEKLSARALPDIIIMDIDMPDMNGYEAVEWLKTFYPSISILVISMFDSEEAILSMMKLKVNGFLTKDIEVGDIHQALNDIISKGFYYTDQVCIALTNDIGTDNNEQTGSKAAASADKIKLSVREREFIKLACTELTYKKIAEKMTVSEKTVEGYRESLFQRFTLKNRVSLAMFAVRNGLVKP